MRGEPTIGELRTSVTIQRATTTQGTAGGLTDAWATLLTTRGKVVWSGGDEVFEGRRDRADTSVTAVIRYPSELVKAKDRMLIGRSCDDADALTCDIENTPHDLNGRRRWLVIRAVHRG